VNADSLCRVVAPCDRPDLQEEVDSYNEVAVFESWDMLCGRLHPELGGSPDHLDIVGVNYYWTNQWQIDQPGIPLSQDDPRIFPLHRLIADVADRYQRPIAITETSHVNENRAPWIRELGEEVARALSSDIPLWGACIYPVLGMPEWHDQKTWTQMGLWDLVDENGTLIRVPNVSALEAFEDAKLTIEGRLV
jgi:hypothetical protein